MSGFNWRASKTRRKPTASIFAEPEMRCASELGLLRTSPRYRKLSERDKTLARGLVVAAAKHRLSAAQLRQVRRLAGLLMKPKKQRTDPRQAREALRAQHQILKHADMAAYQAQLTASWPVYVRAKEGDH